ncbi:hypothetical protein NDU88_005915 [Pleurodeles waltl]|uniref:Uncharacterized protein n=1 Tax=Pleurodeles waltl TaxID=8319 RepID=A0AAV7PH16_PLEWA|nr:hypothetical protein NDU88_005915 [Pleurodeles waltl]
MNPRDQPEGGRNKKVKGQEKIEHGKLKDQRECEGEKEQRESGYIEKQEKQRRGVSDTGCEIPLASKQMQHNPTEAADRDDTNRRQQMDFET